MNKEILKSFLRSITGNDIMKTNNADYGCVDRFLESDKYKELMQGQKLPIHSVIKGEAETLICCGTCQYMNDGGCDCRYSCVNFSQHVHIDGL